MRLLGIAGLACFVLALSSAAQAQDKASNKDKIVGTWESKEGVLIDFAKDGKMKVSFKIDDKTIDVEGTYSVDGDKLTVNLKQGDQEKKDTATIKKVDDQELVTVDSKGKEDTLKRKK
jgi:uncharacterized protein (TIGR03066 family)